MELRNEFKVLNEKDFRPWQCQCRVVGDFGVFRAVTSTVFDGPVKLIEESRDGPIINPDILLGEEYFYSIEQVDRRRLRLGNIEHGWRYPCLLVPPIMLRFTALAPVVRDIFNKFIYEAEKYDIASEVMAPCADLLAYDANSGQPRKLIGIPFLFSLR